MGRGQSCLQPEPVLPPRGQQAPAVKKGGRVITAGDGAPRRRRVGEGAPGDTSAAQLVNQAQATGIALAPAEVGAVEADPPELGRGQHMAPTGAQREGDESVSGQRAPDEEFVETAGCQRPAGGRCHLEGVRAKRRRSVTPAAGRTQGRGAGIGPGVPGGELLAHGRTDRGAPFGAAAAGAVPTGRQGRLGVMCPPSCVHRIGRNMPHTHRSGSGAESSGKRASPISSLWLSGGRVRSSAGATDLWASPAPERG